jgi:hypothetical protein
MSLSLGSWVLAHRSIIASFSHLPPLSPFYFFLTPRTPNDRGAHIRATKQNPPEKKLFNTERGHAAMRPCLFSFPYSGTARRAAFIARIFARRSVSVGRGLAGFAAAAFAAVSAAAVAAAAAAATAPFVTASCCSSVAVMGL